MSFSQINISKLVYLVFMNKINPDSHNRICDVVKDNDSKVGNRMLPSGFFSFILFKRIFRDPVIRSTLFSTHNDFIPHSERTLLYQPHFNRTSAETEQF